MEKRIVISWLRRIAALTLGLALGVGAALVWVDYRTFMRGYPFAYPPYVTDTGLHIGNYNAIHRSVYWLDDDTIVYADAEPTAPPIRVPREQDNRFSTYPYRRYIKTWRVGDDAPRVVAETSNVTFCVGQGRVAFKAPFEPVPGTDHYRESPFMLAGPPDALKKVRPFTPSRADGPDFIIDPWDCTYEPADARERGSHPTIVYLKKGHGQIRVLNPKRTMDVPAPAATYYPDYPGPGIPLPMTVDDLAWQQNISYHRYRGAYFVFRGRSGKRDENGCYKAFWLWPDGRIEQVCLPRTHWQHRYFRVYPTKGGYFLQGNAVTEGYLLRDKRLYLVLKGGVSEAAVAPDGCRVAVNHVGSRAHGSDPLSQARRLLIVDVCGPSDQFLDVTDAAFKGSPTDRSKLPDRPFP